ncbi:MAG: hypothetical protein QXS68_06045 [Candidatus Methanomethylicaceae archaeon]|jgi:hypothetical protein
MQSKENQILFGFLPYKGSFQFNGGVILPVPEYDKVASWVDKYTNEDGFLYPPTERRMQLDLKTQKPVKVIPKTKRPALLHRVPASHELLLSASGTTEEIQKGPGAFIIHLLAYLFQIRLQFQSWWFDRRVPIRCPRNFDFNEGTAEDFLSHCYKTWQGWNEREQRLITNVLYMHSRVPSYEWDWERFTIEYMVLDACWKLALRLFGVNKKTPHKDRIKVLCNTFQIPYDENLVTRIVELRNTLFHETLWDGSQPCTTVSDDAFQQPGNLRRINQRIIPALFGYKTSFIRNGWWSLSPSWFDKPNPG